jgi:hypothetical protein
MTFGSCSGFGDHQDNYKRIKASMITSDLPALSDQVAKMIEEWITSYVHPFRAHMPFLTFYGNLKASFHLISDEDYPTRARVEEILKHVFEKGQEEEPMDHDMEDEIHQDSDTLDPRLQHTYSPLKPSHPQNIHIPLSIRRKRDLLYKACLGYIPSRDQLPKNIDIARALAMELPPPHLPSLSMWKHLGLSVEDRDCNDDERQRNIVINTIVPDRDGIREFRVLDAKGLMEYCHHFDESAGEVFTTELWCTCVTVDIDGKTCDAKHYGASKCYPLLELKTELVSAMRYELLDLTNKRWDTDRHPPVIHMWKPEESQCPKLSLRISVHFPINVCFKSVDGVSLFIRRVCENLKKMKARYLILHHVMCNGIKFERSNMERTWIGMDSHGQRISIEDVIRERPLTRVEVCDGEYCFSKDNRGQIHVIGNNIKSLTRVMDVGVWINHHLDMHSSRECLVDCGIYHNNRSLRLPHQSKIEQSASVRRFTPVTKDSTVLDALLHYPHTDVPRIPGPPIILTLGVKHTHCVASSHSSVAIDKAKDLILSKYNMTVTKITERDGRAYMDVKRGGDNFCLIKGDVHTSASMYFILDRDDSLRVGCWSTKCRTKQNNMSVKI